MRERQCAEMLRGVLVACPSLASFMFKWLAKTSGVPSGLIDELNWHLETEQSIGAKRDDLRIEGWRTDDDGPQRAVLWTVEIKVAAPLHESSLQDWEEEPETTSDEDPEMVSQLLNYDRWLAHQTSDYRAGFVLALRDKSAEFPDGLSQPWNGITWTELALEVERVLATDLLPISERPLARHMLGFIRHRLWDTTDMATSQLELDDVALLRAHAAIGSSCARKLKDLVKEFEKVLKATRTRFSEIKSTSVFFDRTDTVQYYVWAACTSDPGEITVCAGVVADAAVVWIWSNPRSKERKQAIRRLLRDRHLELSDRNPSWIIMEADAAGGPDAEITKPLTSVLSLEDWQKPLIEFVRDSVGDLKEVGILTKLLKL